MKKTGKIYLEFFSVISTITFLWIFLMVLYRTIKFSFLSVLLAILLIAVVFLFGCKWYVRIEEQQMLRIYLVMQILSCLFMVYIAWNLRVSIYHTWDYGRLLRDGMQLARTDTFENFIYYVQYPNNLLLLLILEVLFKIVLFIFPAASNGVLQSSSILLSCLLTQTAMLLVYASIKRVFGRKRAAFTGCALTLASPLYLYATFAYTDTFSLPLIMGQIYFYIRFCQKKDKARWIDLIITAVIGAIGFKLKMTVFFVLIAAMIHLFLQGKAKEFFKGAVLTVVVVAIICSVIGTGISAMYKITPEISERYEFPYTHWIMMTLNETGGYNEDDVQYTSSFETYDVKVEADLKLIRERISSRGIAGTIEHVLKTKIIRTWGTGSMAGDDYISRQPLRKNYLQTFLCQGGRYHNFYVVYSQTYHLFMLFFILYYLIMNVRAPKAEIENVFVTTIWGLAVFLCIWECNSRYLFQMLPVMVMLMMSGVNKRIEVC